MLRLLALLRAGRFFPRRWRFSWRYITGDLPWDSGIVPPEITAWIAQHEADGLPPGRALDLGCGTGTTSLYLAERGWDVIGLDYAPTAIQRARRKARGRDLSGTVQFMSADVSRPELLDGAGPFDLVIDIGCLHAIPADLRPGYAANLIRLTQPGTAYLLYAFLPDRNDQRGPLGLNADTLHTLFDPTFSIDAVALNKDSASEGTDSGWYTLHRTEAAP